MKKFIFLVLILLLSPMTIEARSGCCSHHGGVSGCDSSGRQICNDGTLSPSCTCTPTYIYGCTDSTAKNYNSKANKNDGSCKYYVKGCTDSLATNYNSKADKDDGTCIKAIYGCMDKNAENYNKLANIDDHNCQYKKAPQTTATNHPQNNIATETKKENSESGNILGGVAGLGIIGAAIYFVRIAKNK